MAEERWNYFNYFTEIEEHFQRVRGTGMFLLSPLDWALLESWKNSGIPLEAVMRGIEVAFAKWRKKPGKRTMINSIAYCAQAVQEEAEAMAKGAVSRGSREIAPPFPIEALRDFLAGKARTMHERAGYEEVATALDTLLTEAETHYADLEELEQRLTSLEDKMSAIARASVTEEELFQMRRELDSTLKPYRGKMNAEQIAMLERQYLDRKIQEKAGLPRLSLFYL